MNMNEYDWERLAGLGWGSEFAEKMKNDPCWKGYQMIGEKTKNGKKVPNCVPVKKKGESSDHAEVKEATGDLKDACWDGYTAVGMKNKNGKKVPNCVKVKKDAEHAEGFDINEKQPVDEMAIGNALPKEPGTGPAKNPQMKEAGIRMPRMEEIVKSSNRNGHLAMAAAPNYAETEDFSDGLHSMEPNAAMAINQLRVMREKIDIMLGILYPDDNMEPWMATKLTMSAQNLASVADYMRFGVEL